jgi:adenosylcobinamide-GDP ribazoletransferase
MIFLRSVAMAFTMFSCIPMPKLAWQEENMRYMLCGMPFIGAVIGLLLWGWAWFCGFMSFGVFLQAAGFTILPVAVTGGIHLDGFCDTVDALASHAEPERKRQILKDPHTGAFAIIGVSCYFLLYFGFCTELVVNTENLLLLGFIHVVSRSLSGFSGICFPSSSPKGLLKTFKLSANKKSAAAMLLIMFLLCCAAMLCIGSLIGVIMLLAALLCVLYLFVMSRKQFGGMSGDLAGYFLQVCELFMLIVLVVMQKAVL